MGTKASYTDCYCNVFIDKRTVRQFVPKAFKQIDTTAAAEHIMQYTAPGIQRTIRQIYIACSPPQNMHYEHAHKHIRY